MGAIWRGCKQFDVYYVSDRKVCGGYEHPAGNASSIKSAKSIIRNVRKNEAEFNPRNFKVYDVWADLDPETDHTPCVYEEA